MKKVIVCLFVLFVSHSYGHPASNMFALTENDYRTITSGPLWETVKNVNARLATADGIACSVEIIDRTDSVLPSVASGNRAYITLRMLQTIGQFPDEVAAVLAPLRVLAKNRYPESRVGANIGQALLGALVKDGRLRDVAQTALSLGTSSASRKEISQSYIAGLESMIKAGYDPSALYSVQTRFQTLAEQSSNEPFAEYFSIYPSTTVILETVLQRIIVRDFGRDIRQALAPTAKAASDVLAEFDNHDSRMPAAYRAATGYDLPNMDNYWKTYRQCTWFAAAARADIIPRGPVGENDAHTWLDRCQKAGYAVVANPAVGTISVWNKKVGGGAGHVAIVTKVYDANTFEVWDCNWGPEAKDKDPLNGRVRHRIVRDRKNISGFIGWPNGQTEAPIGVLGYTAPGRSTIELVRDEFHLGDDRPNSKVIRMFSFDVTASDLNGPRIATLRAWIKAMPQKDPIFTINSTEFGRVVAEVAEWTQYEFVQPVTKLHVGTNLLVVRTITPSFGAGYDACDIKGITLTLEK